MKPLLLSMLVIFACSSSSPERATSGGRHQKMEVGSADELSAPKSGILVELFTSQGCSSCPPADKLLSTINADTGPEVIALAYHVDYWNYIGWEDPYSSPEWSSRQRGYASKISAGRNYTPQLVVNGRNHAVGSHKDKVRALIDAERRIAQEDVRVSAVSAPGGDHSEIHVQVETDVGTLRRESELWAAVFEDDLEVRVLRGENAGRTLRNDRVVRHLENLGPLETGRYKKSFRVDVARDWRREKLGVVFFVQDRKSLEVLAAVEVRP
ncbi:MAG: DUF1223 domain-containing protein [Kofleriaceae bacterium]|nr:DUF1223 domain-containing protein [Kofleriaceae bacterium]